MRDLLVCLEPAVGLTKQLLVSCGDLEDTVSPKETVKQIKKSASQLPVEIGTG